jgi:hypothetical protein
VDTVPKIVVKTDTIIQVDTVYMLGSGPGLEPVGVPLGTFGIWYSGASDWTPFAASQNYSFTGDTLIKQLAEARAKKHHLVLALTGGSSTAYTTNGKFDMTKWRARLAKFDDQRVKDAIALAVNEGIVLGYALLDEPEHKNWGGALTKPMLDQMAMYAKALFPNLPVGVNHGPNGYQWRRTEKYTKVDYVMNQYNWWITKGNVTAWRDSVLQLATRDGYTPAFSVNLLAGGQQISGCTGPACCPIPETGGVGNNPNTNACKMSPANVRDWGTALGPFGCMMFMWRYDQEFMSNPLNHQAFTDVATLLKTKTWAPCRR